MAPYSNIPIWVLRDFNNFLDKDMDTFSSYSGCDAAMVALVHLLDCFLKLDCKMCGGIDMLIRSVTHVIL